MGPQGRSAVTLPSMQCIASFSVPLVSTPKGNHKTNTSCVHTAKLVCKGFSVLLQVIKVLPHHPLGVQALPTFHVSSHFTVARLHEISIHLSILQEKKPRLSAKLTRLSTLS